MLEGVERLPRVIAEACRINWQASGMVTKKRVTSVHGHRHRAASCGSVPEQGERRCPESSTLPNLTVTKRVFCSTANCWHTISAMRLVVLSIACGIHRLVGGDQHAGFRRRLRIRLRHRGRASTLLRNRPQLRLEQRNLFGRPRRGTPPAVAPVPAHGASPRVAAIARTATGPLQGNRAVPASMVTASLSICAINT